MAGARDIDALLKGWEFQPGEVSARLVKARNGRDLIQMRVDMGLLQMETDLRPDGLHPHGAETFFDYLVGEAVRTGERFRLTKEQCAEADREFVQYYHRRICWLSLREYRRAALDADHSLAFMDFVREHSPDEEWTLSHEQYRPFVLFHRVQATALATLEEKGAAWFRQELETRLGYRLADAKPYRFEKQGDHFGWDTAADGTRVLGLYVEAGRVKDQDGYRLKAALVAIAQRFGPEFRLTPSQNIIIAHIAAADQAAVTQVLADHGIPVASQATAIRRASMACPSMPTCGLGLAESERYLPTLMTHIEGLLAEVGLADEEIIIRMTGCPNGCARPYMAEIGLVGKGPGRYQLYLGGNEACTRLNRLYKDVVKDPELVDELRPLLTRYAKERVGGERFGDWVARAVWTTTTAATN